MDYNLIMHAVDAVIILLNIIILFFLFDKLKMAEFERDLLKYELTKLQAYRKATDLDSD